MTNLFSIDNILFSVGGYGVSFLELCSTVTGLASVFFAARSKSYNFWIGYVYTIFLFMLFMQKHLYSSMILQPISLGFTIFGHYRWTHPKKNEAENAQQELKVTTLSNQRRIFYIVLIIVMAAIWGFILSKLGSIFPDKFPPARLPFLDATITMLILTAQYLSAQKKLECWVAWMTVNVTNLTQYLLVGLIFMPIVCAVYFIFAIIGITTWYKEMKSR